MLESIWYKPEEAGENVGGVEVGGHAVRFVGQEIIQGDRYSTGAAQ